MAKIIKFPQQAKEYTLYCGKCFDKNKFFYIAPDYIVYCVNCGYSTNLVERNKYYNKNIFKDKFHDIASYVVGFFITISFLMIAGILAYYAEVIFKMGFKS